MARAKHGRYASGRSKAVVALQNIRQRCRNPRNEEYANYGGRGITVCERWSGKGGLHNFLEDMGIPEDGMSIDRIDNNGNYEPSNCRWATPKQQTINRRQTVYLEHNGKRMTIEGWAEELGVKAKMLSERYRRRWTTGRILGQTKQIKGVGDGCNTALEYRGEKKTLSDLAELSGLSVGVITTRIRRGWSEDRILAPRVFKRSNA